MNAWTKEELAYEWRVIYDTRLGDLCGVDEPTDDQKQIARDEADAHIARLKARDTPPPPEHARL